MIKIGTDCSGIDGPIECLKQLKINYIHSWSCDINPYCEKIIKHNYNPTIFFNNIIGRDHTTLPDVDIYICGFPCQPFSTIGKKEGSKDERSNIMIECINTIKAKTPKVFILENVKNFKTIENGKNYKYLMKELKSIKQYNIYPHIYNTKDYGIPQNRERLYIVGIKKRV